ncbi:MAG: hypothetical protein LBB42_02840, partial [Coriobacteriales bacterium]|nr:hypothetical protein [Coriobacteriales bacterium]
TAGATLAANGFIIPAGLTPGSYTVTLSASNVGGTATKTVSIVVNPKPFAPTITGGSEVITLSAGYAATTSAYPATGYPVPTFSLTNNTAKATINAHGTLTIPAGLAVGTYEVTINAANTVGSATKTVAVKVNAVPVKPTITGADTITRTEGYTEILERYTITGYPDPVVEIPLASNNSEADIWSGIVGIPAGLTPGTYTFAITAKNTQGTVSKKVTVKINPKPVAPTIKNAGKTITLKKNYKKTTKTYTVKGTPKPKVTLSAPKNAKGKIKIDQNGKLTIAKGLKKGTYKITITAKSTAGTVKQTVTIKVK